MEIDYTDVRLSHIEKLIQIIKDHYPDLSSDDISIYFLSRDVSEKDFTPMAITQVMGLDASPEVCFAFVKNEKLIKEEELDDYEKENYTKQECLEEAIRIVCEWEFNRCVKKENNFDYQKLITILKKGLEINE